MRLPETRSPFAARARGGSGYALSPPRSDAERSAEIAAFLKPDLPQSARRAERSKPQPLHTAPALVASAESASPAPAPAQALAVATAAPTAAPPSAPDLERYAQREAAAQDLQRFRGGEAVVVISATTVILVLLIVLLIVWLT